MDNKNKYSIFNCFGAYLLKNGGLWLAILGFLLLGATLQAQNVKGLESKKSKLYKEIKLSTQLLKETRNAQETSVNELKLLKEQLKSREELLSTLTEQLENVQSNIVELDEDIKEKEDELEAQKQEYAKLIRYAYKNRTKQSMLWFLFSAQSFNDAYKRIQYIRQYNNYRIQQVALIKEQQDTIAIKIAELELEKNKKADILQEETEARNQIVQEKQEKDLILYELKQKEQKLNDEIETKKVAIESLEREIRSIIKANLAKKNETPPKSTSKTATAAKKKSPDVALSKTPEVKKLSANFSQNKGKLPWPVEEGIITGRFGKHRHSEASNVQVENPGIDIATKKGSKVRVVFEGVVTNILYNPIFKSAVIVKHGTFFSVYSNLENVTVAKGDQVNSKQVIGEASTNQNGKTEVHFEVWEETNKLNPSRWLAKK